MMVMMRGWRKASGRAVKRSRAQTTQHCNAHYISCTLHHEHWILHTAKWTLYTVYCTMHTECCIMGTSYRKIDTLYILYTDSIYLYT